MLLDRCDMKEISIIIDRGEGREEKDKERRELVHLDIQYFNKNDVEEQENDLKTIRNRF